MCINLPQFFLHSGLYRSGIAEENSRGKGGSRQGGNRLAHAGLGMYHLFGIPEGVTDLAVEHAEDDDTAYVDNEGKPHTLKKVDYFSAREHLQRAANAGDVSACYILGKLRLLGLFVRPDAKKAYALFAKSAQGGNPLAKKMMAHMAFAGVGTGVSCATAAK